MKRSIVRNVLIAKLAALTLVALIFPQSQIRAKGMTEQNLVLPPVGLAAGQSLRFTLFLPNGTYLPNGTPVRARVKLHDERGAVIAQSYEATIAAGQFRYFIFYRNDIPLAGEAGTGRIQLGASLSSSVRLTFSEAIDPVVISIETISISDGTSNAMIVGEVIPAPGGGGNDLFNSGFRNDIMMGICSDQRLVVTISRPASTGSAAQCEPVKGHVKVFDGNGNLIAQSPEKVIPSGGSPSFQFNRNEIPLPGEPGTNRAQVRIRPFFTCPSAPQGADLSLNNVISFEVVDTSKGKTFLIFVSGPNGKLDDGK
ncbi:MAG TPA: hypothetical protein VJ810_04530 [Blastocatellia bacterium]|nr:hypothetical protein [Blastocatellia bacterium]